MRWDSAAFFQSRLYFQFFPYLSGVWRERDCAEKFIHILWLLRFLFLPQCFVSIFPFKFFAGVYEFLFAESSLE